MVRVAGVPARFAGDGSDNAAGAQATNWIRQGSQGLFALKSNRTSSIHSVFRANRGSGLHNGRGKQDAEGELGH